jgi:hypothetical protein
MYRFVFFLLIIFFSIILPKPTSAVFEDNASSIFSGQIIKDANIFGGFWYVNPSDFHRYNFDFNSKGFGILSNLSLGVSNDDFDKLTGTTSQNILGKFLIKTQDGGRIFYIDYQSGSPIYIGNTESASFLFDKIATSVSSCVLRDIPVAKMNMDNAGRETGREWQYNGWWGKVNNKYAPIMTEPKVKSKKVGAFSQRNRVKVVALVKSEGKVWCKVDGGMHPGTFVEAKFIDPLPQPSPEKAPALLQRPVASNEYWVDVNLSKYVLTMYKGGEAVFATYVSIGMDDSPTLPGAYSVTHKYIKTRMHGAPPKATHYYDLKDVPWTMYYYDSYALHGAYWQDEFGGKRSSGCTNLTIGDAKFLFGLLWPKGAGEKVRYSKTNPGSLVYNHY